MLCIHPRVLLFAQHPADKMSSMKAAVYAACVVADTEGAELTVNHHPYRAPEIPRLRAAPRCGPASLATSD